MADQKLNVKISGDSKELDQSLKNTAKEIRKVSQEATRAQQNAAKNVAKVADELGKAGTSGANGLKKMVMGMSSVAAWGGVVVGAIQKIHEVWEGFVVRGFERAIELSKQASESITESSDTNVKKWQDAGKAITDFYEKKEKYQKNRTASNYLEMQRAQDAMDKSGLPANMLRGWEEGAQLQFVYEQEKNAIEDAIKGLSKEQDRLDKEFEYYSGKILIKPETKNEMLAKIQMQKNDNSKELRNLIKRQHELKNQNPYEDWKDRQFAQSYDWLQQNLAKAQENQVKELNNLRQAQASYQQALLKARDAQAQLDEVKREQAREAKEERLSNRRERLKRKMGAFGFSLPEDFNVNLKGKALSDRRRQKALDSSISDKVARQEAGQRVHWTTQERKRIQEYQKLDKKDKSVEAAQKQMEAADKQKAAAETLQQASNELRNAQYGVQYGYRGVLNARGRFNEARRRTGYYSLADRIIGWRPPTNREISEMDKSDYRRLIKEESNRIKERQKREKEERRKKSDANARLTNMSKGEMPEIAKHPRRPIARGVLQDIETRKVTEENAKWLEGIYNNTKDIGGNIYIVK